MHYYSIQGVLSSEESRSITGNGP